MNNYELLLQRIDAFTRKYYANQLLRGVLLFSACVLAYVLLAGVGEYFLYFSSWIKISIIALLAVAGGLALVMLIISPLLKMQRLGKIISHQQAALIIGSHFPEVSDKLLNVLQLRNSAMGTESRELIEAGIDQKAKQISVVPFLKAVDLGRNKKYLPYVLPPALIMLALFVASPNIFRDASSRLLQPTKNFTPPAPFQFLVQNKDFKAALYDSYTLQVKVSGKEIPQRIFVVADGEEIEMQPQGKAAFTYTFQHIAKNIDFHLTAAGYSSENYNISVIEKPGVEAFAATLIYPAHTGKKSETLRSLSDMTIPEGTIIKWEIQAKNTDQVTLKFGSQGAGSHMLKEDNTFRASAKFLSDTAYSFTILLHTFI